MIKAMLHQRENGYWYVILRYTDKDKKQTDKWITTKTKKKSEASLLIKDIQKKYAYLDHGAIDYSITVSDYLLNWKENRKNKIATSSYESYHTYFDKHLIPDFAKKDILLRDLTAKDINEYIEDLQVNGRIKNSNDTQSLSLCMTRKIFSLLKRALNDAVTNGYIDNNPAMFVKVEGVKDAGKKQEKHILLSKEECQAVIDACKDSYIQPIVYIALYYGLRRSEILGLKWSAIDFENDTIKIQHTVVKNHTVIAKDSTKTDNSRATMSMIPEIKEMLLRIKKQEDVNRELFGNQYVENDYVFKHDDGNTYYPDSITKTFQRILKENNLPNMRFHDLRKSAASFLFNSGLDINSVREWLRHADIETTANIYTEISKLKMTKIGNEISNSFHL